MKQDYPPYRLYYKESSCLNRKPMKTMHKPDALLRPHTGNMNDGKTLTENLGLDVGYAMHFKGGVTITNGNIVTNSRYPIVIDNNSTRLAAAFTDVTITGHRNDDANNGAVILIGNAEVTIGTGVEITANAYSCAVESSTNDDNDSPALVSISSGANIALTSTNTDATAIGAGYGSTINVTGGTIEGTRAASVYPTGGTINISGGTINGNLYVHQLNSGVTTGAISVTGGTFSVDPSEFVSGGTVTGTGPWTVQ